MKTISATLAVTFLLMLFLASCAAVAPASTVRIANGIDMQLLLPTQHFSLSQKISARYKQDQHTLIMQVQASPQQIIMAGLTPTGTRLFSLTFDGKTIESWKSPLFTAPFDGSYVLADFELASLEVAALRTALPGNVTLTESFQDKASHERILLNANGKTVIRIEYHDKQTRYCHLERDYCLQIDTLQ